MFRSNSFEDDKQSTFIRFISRSEGILGDFCLGQSDARAAILDLNRILMKKLQWAFLE